jgi:hypothetical protein
LDGICFLSLTPITFPLKVEGKLQKRKIEMSYLVVITFDDPKSAGKVRHTLSSVQDTGHLNLDDSAVIV